MRSLEGHNTDGTRTTPRKRPALQLLGLGLLPSGEPLPRKAKDQRSMASTRNKPNKNRSLKASKARDPGERNVIVSRRSHPLCGGVPRIVERMRAEQKL